MDVASFTTFRNVQKAQIKLKVLTLHPYYPELNPIESLWDILDKQVWAKEADPHNVRRDKDVNTTGHLQECVGVQVRAAVATWTMQYEAGRHAVMPNWCTDVLNTLKFDGKSDFGK